VATQAIIDHELGHLHCALEVAKAESGAITVVGAGATMAQAAEDANARVKPIFKAWSDILNKNDSAVKRDYDGSTDSGTDTLSQLAFDREWALSASQGR
jgi:hypothetical protein